MTAPTWTKAEIAEFDRIIDDSEARDQVTRIAGRLALRTFVSTHGKEKCDAMWAVLQARDAAKRKAK